MNCNLFKKILDTKRFYSVLRKGIKLFDETVTKTLKQFPDLKSEDLPVFKTCHKNCL